MSVLKYQSDEELIRVMDEWVRNFLPPNVVKNAKNIQLIGDRCLLNSGGIISITGLTEATHQLGTANLELIPEPPKPKELTLNEKAAIIQAQQLKRIQREQLENSEAAFFERVKAAETAKNLEKEAKRQDDGKDALNSEIQSYECYRGPNARDWSAINMVIADLKRIAVRTSGKIDFVRTLALVKEVKSALPDRPKLGDVDRIVRRISEQHQAARENPVDRKTLEASSWAQRPR